MSGEPAYDTPADIPLESSHETTAFPPSGAPNPDESAGSAVTQQLPADAPPVIPDVTLEATLGKGGMGTVYKGRQITLDRPVAVKAIHPALAKERSFVERFQREAKVLAKLSHPGIVACYQAGLCAQTGKHYLLMEFVDGEDLAKRVKQKGPLSEQDALVLAREVASGLEHALEEGVIHRDVKPENILLKNVPRAATTIGVQAKIVDLGLAALVQPDAEALRITAAGTALGTPLTMAPEQADTGNVDHRADIYALGCTLFFAVTGRFPHEGGSVAQVISKKLRGETKDPRELRPDLSQGTSELIRRMIQFDPAARPATYEELLALFDEQLARFPSVPRTSTAGLRKSALVAAPSEPAPRGGAGSKLAVVALLGAVLGSGGVWWATHREPPNSGPSTPPVPPHAPPTPPHGPPPPPAPPPKPPSPGEHDPTKIAWGDAWSVIGDGADRFARLDLEPKERVWLAPGDDEEQQSQACNAQTRGGIAHAWIKRAVAPPLLVEGYVQPKTSKGLGVAVAFESGKTFLVSLQAIHVARGDSAAVGPWLVRIVDQQAPPLAPPLGLHTYLRVKGLRQHFTVIVRQDKLVARIKDDDQLWASIALEPKLGKLAKVGLFVEGLPGDTAAFDHVGVKTPKD